MTYTLNGRSATGLSPSEVGCRWSELAVTAGSRREAPRARLALAGLVRGLAQRELIGHRGGQGLPRALPRGAAVASPPVWRGRPEGPPQPPGFFPGRARPAPPAGPAQRQGPPCRPPPGPPGAVARP